MIEVKPKVFDVAENGEGISLIHHGDNCITVRLHQNGRKPVYLRCMTPADVVKLGRFLQAAGEAAMSIDFQTACIAKAKEHKNVTQNHGKPIYPPDIRCN